MPMTKIDLTRKFFIEKYGEPKVEIKDGKKYRFVNTYLENFDKMMDVVFKLAKQYDILLTENQIDVFCEFAMNDVQPNIENVANKLGKYIAVGNEKINNGKKAFCRLLTRFEEFKKEDNYSPYYTMHYFVEYYRCSDVNNRGNLRAFM